MRGKTFSQTIYVWFYLIYLIVAGGLCVFMTPPFRVPDEPNHFMRAVQIAQGQIFIHRRSSTEVGSNLPQSILDLNQIFPHPTPTSDLKVQPAAFAQAMQLKWASPPAFVNLWNTDLYPPSSYIGSVVAVAVARHLGFMPLATFYLARLGNLIVDGAIGLLALFLAEEAAGYLLLLLAFPTSLSLTASCSQDGMVIALSALFASCLLRLSKNPQKSWSPWVVLTMGIALGCMAAGKAPYIALLLLVWLFSSKQNIKMAVFASFISLGIFLFWLVFNIRIASVAYGLPHSSPSGQVNFLLHHMLAALKLFAIRNFLSIPPARDAIAIIGWIGLNFPRAFYNFAYFVSGFVFIYAFASQKARFFSQKFFIKLLLFCGILICAYELVYLALYITWTPVGMNVIEGVQQRYFLPLFMMLALAPRLAPASTTIKTLYASYFWPYLEKLVLLAFMLWSIYAIYGVLSSQYW